MNEMGAEVQRGRVAELQRCRGAEPQSGGRDVRGRQDPTAVPPYRPTALPPLLVLCVVFALSSCSRSLDPRQYPTPEALYDVSVAAFERGDCGDAEIGFQRLSTDLAARDPRRAVVRYRLAECHYKRNRFLEAAREFRRVADENAQDSLAPQALVRAGDSNARLWRRPELDATYGLSALTVYSEVLTRYPASPAATEARERIGELNEQFASKAYKTGTFYFRLKAYDSAIIYFRTLVADYPQTSFASEALLRLVEAYERIGYEEDKQDMCLQLQRYYPESVIHAPSCVSDTTST
ncbi:outer membrane protein assembly factor BamD [Gemmatimonadota bacterium]